MSGKTRDLAKNTDVGHGSLLWILDTNLLRIGALYIPFPRVLSVIWKLLRSGKRHLCVTNKERQGDPSPFDWFKKWRKARGHS